MPEGNTASYQYFIRSVSSYCLKSLNQSDHQVDLGLNQASCLNQACKIVGCVPSPAWAEGTVLSLCVCLSVCYHEIAVNFNYLEI